MVAGALALCAALVVAPALSHFDEVDSQTYQTVIRHMREDGAWLDLRYLPQVYPRFYEQLPFGFWPYVIAALAAGERALPVVATAFTLATYLLLAFLGWRRGGPMSSALAVLLLGTCESFFLYGSRPLLEPPLLFFTTLAATPLLLGPMSRRGWLLCLGASALGVLIKGPFGLLPLFAFGLAAVRSTRALALVLVAGVAATFPLAAFLVHDAVSGTGTWWSGYVEGHVLAAATGARDEFHRGHLFPFASLAERLGPAVVLVAIGAALFVWKRSALPEPLRRDWSVLGLGTLLLLLLLTIPAQQNWTHVLVAYPFVALLAALGLAPWLEPAMRPPRRQFGAALALGSLALAAWIAAGLGAGRRMLPAPCLLSEGELSTPLAALPALTPIAVVTPHPWSTIALLAAEGHLAPAPATLAEPGEARYAVVLLELWAPQAGWSEVGRDAHWVLAARRGVNGTAP